MRAKEELRRIEESTDWSSLCDQALADPPNPHLLSQALNHWAIVFRRVYEGEPLLPDFPDPLRKFFLRLGSADYPPELWSWIEAYESKHGRQPKLAEIPARLRTLLPATARPKGRPRCDTQRLLAARRAWERACLSDSYKSQRDIIAVFGKLEVTTNCFGFDQADMRGDTPSRLALEKQSEVTGKSVDYIKDLIRNSNRK